MKLPIFQQSGNQPFMLMQTRWASMLNPVLGNLFNNATFVTNISLTTGANVINHNLGHTPQGWFITDINASATVYRSAAFNSTTLTLTSSAPATISLAVF